MRQRMLSRIINVSSWLFSQEKKHNLRQRRATLIIVMLLLPTFSMLLTYAAPENSAITYANNGY